jgi:hypothetical protein
MSALLPPLADEGLALVMTSYVAPHSMPHAPLLLLLPLPLLLLQTPPLPLPLLLAEEIPRRKEAVVVVGE